MADHSIAAEVSAPERARERTSRRPSSRTVARVAVQLSILAVFLVAWELASGRLMETFFMSKPTLVFDRFWMWLTDGTIWHHAIATFRAATLGFWLGAAIAITFGYAMGVSPFWSSVFEPFISAAWAIPRIALIPLLIVWIGIGPKLAIAIAAIIVFFLIFYNTYHGVREVPRELIDSVRIMGGSRRDVATKVRLPSALVWILAGARLSVPQALVAVVVAEMLASNRGLGYLVSHSAAQFNVTGTFAALLALLIVGYSLDRALALVARRAAVWKGDIR